MSDHLNLKLSLLPPNEVVEESTSEAAMAEWLLEFYREEDTPSPTSSVGSSSTIEVEGSSAERRKNLTIKFAILKRHRGGESEEVTNEDSPGGATVINLDSPIRETEKQPYLGTFVQRSLDLDEIRDIGKQPYLGGSSHDAPMVYGLAGLKEDIDYDARGTWKQPYDFGLDFAHAALRYESNISSDDEENAALRECDLAELKDSIDSNAGDYEDPNQKLQEWSLIRSNDPVDDEHGPVSQQKEAERFLSTLNKQSDSQLKNRFTISELRNLAYSIQLNVPDLDMLIETLEIAGFFIKEETYQVVFSSFPQ